MGEFIENGMVAIGWPALGDMKNCSREQIRKRLTDTHCSGAASRVVGQVTGIVDRFVNQIKVSDYVVIPDGTGVYFGKVVTEYEFVPTLQAMIRDTPNG